MKLKTKNISVLVMFRPGLAQKPQLWPGFRRLWPAKNPSQAKAANDGWLWPGSGLSCGSSREFAILLMNRGSRERRWNVGGFFVTCATQGFDCELNM
ncbi:uncharacterized protein F5147DRAFT_698007 [Suillus discolor]|uniref:Uncharacterized protein n=1 Tax=Suillus discolor TaxID=1912936 RepID=A0A9P7F6R3_9AGAM|nr:uncharacterized protein F5147DRAFT_698007 [Suillus discolor]KAG2107191.1 hypothetical protein F5147DRAFT_698007 [Suillus discolor]